MQIGSKGLKMPQLKRTEHFKSRANTFRLDAFVGFRRSLTQADIDSGRLDTVQRTLAHVCGAEAGREG